MPIGIDYANNTYWIFKKEDTDRYKKKFGDQIWRLILERKVKLGMTKEMCRLSWGKPKTVNKTTASHGVHEQWVYSDNYLYFENGILTAIQ